MILSQCYYKSSNRQHSLFPKIALNKISAGPLFLPQFNIVIKPVQFWTKMKISGFLEEEQKIPELLIRRNSTSIVQVFLFSVDYSSS